LLMCRKWCAKSYATPPGCLGGSNCTALSH